MTDDILSTGARAAKLAETLRTDLDQILRGKTDEASLRAFNSALDEYLTASPERQEIKAKGLAERRADLINKYSIEFKEPESISYTIPKGMSALDLLKDAASLAEGSNGKRPISQYAMERFTDNSAFKIKVMDDTGITVGLSNFNDNKPGTIHLDDRISPKDCILTHQIYLALTGVDLFKEREVEVKGLTLWCSPDKGLGVGITRRAA